LDGQTWTEGTSGQSLVICCYSEVDEPLRLPLFLQLFPLAPRFPTGDHLPLNHRAPPSAPLHDPRPSSSSRHTSYPWRVDRLSFTAIRGTAFKHGPRRLGDKRYVPSSCAEPKADELLNDDEQIR
jgi:hypothetical protein